MAISLSPEQHRSLKHDLAVRESSNRYDNDKNPLGYLGKYQFGAQAAETVGYLKPGSYAREKNGAFNNPANWTGKDGATSKSTFLNNPTAQENAMDNLMQRNYNSGLRSGSLKATSSPERVGGYLAAAHIGGATHATNYYKDGTGFQDAFGTKISEYSALGENAVANADSRTQVPGYSVGSDGRFEKESGPEDLSKTSAVSPTLKTENPDDPNAGKSNQEESATSVTVLADDSIIATEFTKEIETKENPFKKFATSTWSASLYLLPKAEYNKMLLTGERNVVGLPILVQSGGINRETPLFGAKKSTNFNKDFYIDDIEMEGLVSGAATQSVHNQYNLNFTITEPNGITFLDRLKQEVLDNFTDLVTDKRNIPYASQHYLMVIRWYGYDINGNIVDGNQVSSDSVSDNASLCEKFIPFIFKNIRFSITDSIVTYNCEAVCPQSYYGTVPTHTSLQEPVELQGDTVGELISDFGNPDFSLVQRLNAYQQDMVDKEKVQKFPNVYNVVFEEESKLADAKVQRFGQINKSRSPMSNSSTSAKTRKNSDAGSVSTTSRQFTAPQGTSIVRVIEEIVRNSDFVTNQQNILIDKDGKKVPKDQTGEKYFNWFKIRIQAVPYAFDEQRRDYAYNITFVVSLYGTNDIKSPVFPGAYPRGQHKKYAYWFTGENTEVTSLKADFNYLYYQMITPQFPGDFELPVVNANVVERAYVMPRTNQSSIAGDQISAELAAAAAEILYSPADQSVVSLEILGDPDWIAQSEVFYSPEYSLQKVGYKPWMPDGSANFDSSEVFFSIEYNTPTDYGKNGLIDVNHNNVFQQQHGNEPSAHTMKLIYRANKVTTYLKEGAFTQRLEGTLVTYRVDPGPSLEEQTKGFDQKVLEDNDMKSTIENDNETGNGFEDFEALHKRFDPDKNSDPDVDLTVGEGRGATNYKTEFDLSRLYDREKNDKGRSGR